MPNITATTKKIFKHSIPVTIIVTLLVIVIILAIKEQYEYMIAFSGIVFGILAPYFSKNVELEKYRQQLIFERRQNAYGKLMFAIVEYRANLTSMQGSLLLLLKNTVDEEKTKLLLKEIKDAFDENFEKFKKVNNIIAHCYTLFPSELIEYISNNLNKKSIELNKVYQKTFDEVLGNNQKFTEENYNLTYEASIEMNNIIAGIIKIIRKDTGIED